jgi:hypothetical protein
MMADCAPPASPSPLPAPELAALLDRLAAVDVRAPHAEVTERRFQCAWDRLTAVRFLRERWAAFALAADTNAVRVPVPSEEETEPEITLWLWLWPAPVARARGRRTTLQAVFGPVGMAAAGATADDAVPPSVLRLALGGRIEAEVEAGAAWGEGSGAGEGGQGQEKKTGTWSWEVEVAQLDLTARPDGATDGTAWALPEAWPWLEAVTAQVGPAWTWALRPGAAEPEPEPDTPAPTPAPTPTEGPRLVRLPRRGAFRRKWQAAWNLAKPLVAAGKGDVFIGHVLRRHGLPHEPRTVRRIIEAGQAGLLDG